MDRWISRMVRVGTVVSVFAFGAGCADAPTNLDGKDYLPEEDLLCSIPQDEIYNGGPGKDGIPALTDPSFVRADHPTAAYLKDDDRVVGLVLEAGPLAVPLNIFWWHEIVNLDAFGGSYAITHCPLTGSSLAFDRSPVGGAEFGVSGLLYKNNLIMYDRTTNESLWPQMARGARCGSRKGVTLPMIPVIEMTWEGWRELYPETLVVSEETGHGPDYTRYPYGGYDVPTDATTLFPSVIDERRPPKERTLGIPIVDGGLTFPYGLLDERGAQASVTAEVGDRTIVVFWDRSREAAMAYHVELGSETLSFSNGRFVDDQTGSVWSVDGLALEGPLAGQRLSPVPEAFVAFWFAWPEFYPEVRVWDQDDDDGSPPEGI